VLLEPDADGEPPPPLRGAAHDADRVRVVDASTPDRMVLDVTLEADAIVVVADTYNAGWRAWIDGQPTRIHPANLLFRGIPVPAGTHTLELRYAPPAFRWGVLLFSIGAVACCLMIVAPRRAPSRS